MKSEDHRQIEIVQHCVHSAGDATNHIENSSLSPIAHGHGHHLLAGIENHPFGNRRVSYASNIVDKGLLLVVQY